MSNYMFYFAVENGGVCPAYTTEKVFLALSRGSVPIYIGDEKALATMPSPDAFVDLKTFDTPEKLAARLHAIATDQAAYDEVHAWRYRHPSEWSEGFRALLRVMSTDIKYGVCDVLRKGADAVPASAAQADCDYSATAMGRTVGAWPDHGGIRDPLEHLNKKWPRHGGVLGIQTPGGVREVGQQGVARESGSDAATSARRVGSSAGDVERRERKRRVEVLFSSKRNYVNTYVCDALVRASRAQNPVASANAARAGRARRARASARRRRLARRRSPETPRRRDGTAPWTRRWGARGLQRSHRDVRVGGALRQRSGARSAARERREREHRERQGVPPRALRAGGGG